MGSFVDAGRETDSPVTGPSCSSTFLGPWYRRHRRKRRRRHRRKLAGCSGKLPRLSKKDADFILIDFPLAAETRTASINDAGEIVGSYRDAAGNVHGFIYADGIFGTVDVPGARGTILTRIKNGGRVTGFYIDALNGRHGFLGH